MRNMWRRLVLLALALAFVSGLAACEGSEEQPTRAMTVIGTEMAFDAPGRVPAGTYVVTFENAGVLHHELAFRDPSGEVVARRSIGPGETAVLEVDLTPGTWELACHEPGHYEAGMFRPLVVT
jgi:plastocyanin